MATVSQDEYKAVLNSLNPQGGGSDSGPDYQSMLDAIKMGSGGASMQEMQNIAQNGLDPTQGPGAYNALFDAQYLNAGGGLANEQIGRGNNITNWAQTTDYDSLMESGNLDAARTHTMNQYATGAITAEEAQERENAAFEQHYGSLEHTVVEDSVDGPGKDNILSGESWIETTYTPTDYSNLSREAALNQGESHNNIDSEFVSVEGLGGQLFKMAATGALTAGVGAALAPAMVGLSPLAQGAINGGLNSAIGGVVQGNGLDIKDIGIGALTGGIGGSLSDPNGMLGGFIDTGSNIADEAIKGAITGGIGGAFDGDILGGALTGGAMGGGMTALEQGIGWAGDKIGGIKNDLTGPGEFDFASGSHWDVEDQLTNDLNLDMLQEIIPGGEYIEVPDEIQEVLDQQALDEYYSPPEQIQVGNQDIINQMNENDLNAAWEYENSDEFVGPSAHDAADYDPSSPAGQILDNMSQDDVISESYLFDQYGVEMDGTYTIGEIDGKTSIIETATGNYVVSEATAGNPFEVGDPRRSFYEQLSDFDKHLYMAGTLPSPGISASPMDFLDDVPDELSVDEVDEVVEQQEPEQQEQDAAESDPINNTDTSLDTGKEGGGQTGTPSDSVDTAVGTIVSQLQEEQLQAILSQNPALAQEIADQIADIIAQNQAETEATSETETETENQSEAETDSESESESESETTEESESETETTEESETETGSTPTNDDPSPTESNATPGATISEQIAELIASIKAAGGGAVGGGGGGGSVDGGDSASGNPDATSGGQNTDETGDGGLTDGDGTGDGDDTGTGVQTGDGTGTGDEGEDGGDGEGEGDPGIGAGFGGMLAGLGAGAGSGGSGDRPIWTVLDEITKLPGYKKLPKAQKESINEGLMQAAKAARRNVA